MTLRTQFVLAVCAAVAAWAVAAPSAAAAALPLGGVEPLGEERAAQLLGRWDLAELNPPPDATGDAADQARYIQAALVDQEVAEMAAGGDIPEDNLAAAEQLLAGVLNATAATTRRALSLFIIVGANPSTGQIVAYNVFQDEGSPLTVLHTMGAASVLPSGDVEVDAVMAGTMQLKFYFQPDAGVASMAVLNIGSAADGTESMFYGSRFVRANATMAEVLPQLADFLREANATAPAPAGSSADGGGATSAAATRPALAAWAAAALVPAALHLLLV